MIQRQIKEVSRAFKQVSKGFQEGVKDDSRVFVGSVKGVATLGFNFGISTLLEILQSCKLDHEVALFSDWYPPTHPHR